MHTLCARLSLSLPPLDSDTRPLLRRFATASFATSPLPVFLAAWATHSFVLEPLVLWGTYTMAQRRQ